MALTTAQRVDALLKKTTSNGCTPGEQAAAVAKAKEMVAKYQLRAADFAWPPEPKPEPPKAKPAPTKSGKRSDGLQPRYGQLADLLRATKGISVPEIQEALGGNVQPHTVRGMLSILRKKYGLAIETELQRGGSLYRITPK